jgi:hypothetical protein
MAIFLSMLVGTVAFVYIGLLIAYGVAAYSIDDDVWTDIEVTEDDMP